MKILIVEDDVALGNMLKSTLSSMGEVTHALNGEKGETLAISQDFDIVILDLMLPGIQGDEVLRRIRQTKMTPVIILSAITDTAKKIDMLNIGADDYVTKPFSREELIARVNATLRRHNKHFQDLRYTFKGLVVDYVSKMVTIDGERLPVTGKMYDMIELLVKNKEIIVTKQQIFDNVCGFYSDTIQSVIEVYAYKLRKLFDKYGYAECLKTIKTIGYMWTEKESNKD